MVFHVSDCKILPKIFSRRLLPAKPFLGELLDSSDRIGSVGDFASSVFHGFFFVKNPHLETHTGISNLGAIQPFAQVESRCENKCFSAKKVAVLSF